MINARSCGLNPLAVSSRGARAGPVPVPRDRLNYSLLKQSIGLTDVKCVCGTALRVRWHSVSLRHISRYKFRCPLCEAVRPAQGSIVEVSKYQDGQWKRLAASEWSSPPWRGRPTVQH